MRTVVCPTYAHTAQKVSPPKARVPATRPGINSPRRIVAMHHGQNLVSSVLTLQRTAGNRAVTTLLQRSPGPDAPGKQPGGTALKDKPLPKKPRAADYDRVLARLGELITANEDRATRLATYLPLSQSAARLAHQKWATAGANYKTAYETYQGFIRRASEHAKDRNELAKVLIGIGIGVGVGLLGGAAISGVVASRAIMLAVKVVAEAAGEGVELIAVKAINQALKPPDLKDNAGVDPYALGMAQYEKILKVYDTVLDVAVQSANLPLYLRRLEALRGQVRLLKAGAKADTTWDKIVAGMGAAEKAEDEMRLVSYPIDRTENLLSELGKEVVDSPLDFERDIWLAWMATLGPGDAEEGGGRQGHDIDAIEEDIIEDHLVEIGVLGNSGVIGINTQVSDDDDEERAAIDKATELWGKLYYGKYLPMMRG